ncbi:hypothetical protein BGZ54_009747 [Gamsiella multidivaricata]|nr:hypothetical protein BGZ54_009747 [Gamsiella multidivaricata]
MAISPPENKITVIDAETFSRLQNGGSNTSEEAEDYGEQRDADENATSSTSAS